jgi:hypothetical protein
VTREDSKDLIDRVDIGNVQAGFTGNIRNASYKGSLGLGFGKNGWKYLDRIVVGAECKKGVKRRLCAAFETGFGLIDIDLPFLV